VRTNPDGSRILVKDLARVELGVETYNAISRTDGQASALLAIYQSPGSNAVETAEELRAKMETLAKSFPDGMAWNVPMDTTLAITAGIEEIVITLFEALALVILVVFLFIQDWRATLIPSLAIPVSLIGAFMLFPVLGFSINVLSLLGLVLAIGIVVDDAIVVVEAVQVKMEEGLSPKEATSAAMKEVTAPVIATTLVLVAVFVPVAAMGGITGRLYQQFAITIAVSTVFSSINALSLSPALCSLLLKPKKPSSERKGLFGRFFNAFDRWFDRSTGGYIKWASWMGKNTKRGLLFLVIFTIMAGFLGSLVPGGFIPEEDQGYIMVNYQLPDAASMQRSDEVARQVEAILAQQPEIEHYANITGFSLLSGSFSSNVGFVFIGLKPWSDREATAKTVANRLSGIMAKEVKSAIAFAFGPPAIPGLGNGSGFSLMIQDKGGNTPEYLAEYARNFAMEAMKRPEIGNAYTTFTPNVPQRKIELDRDKILKAGLDLNEIYATTAAFLGGTYVNDFNRFGRLYKAYIQAEPEFRQTPDQLNLFFVRNKEGERVPLASFLKVTETYGPEYTYRYNLYRAAEVSGVPAPGYSSAQALDALEEVAAEVLPPDMGYSWSNMSYQEREAGGAGSIVFVFALIFVFLILSAQYESWSLPFAVLLGTPLAMLGAFAFLTVGRFFSDSYENNVFVQISLVMLIAMGAKNAILIVEFAHLEFQKGKGLFDSAMEAAKLRFRPILMTAFSFILGVLPLVTAVGAGAEARKVMGLALLGGMGVATLLGVFFYPMFYVTIGKWAGYERKRQQGK
jgi:HAE1 family hydrophobic/amphiphilic exporter-1